MVDTADQGVTLVGLGRGCTVFAGQRVYRLPEGWMVRLDDPPVERKFATGPSDRRDGVFTDTWEAARMVVLYILARYDMPAGLPPVGHVAYGGEDVLLEFADGRPGGVVTRLDLSISATDPVFRGKVVRVARDEVYRSEKGFDDLRPCEAFSLVAEPVIFIKIEALGSSAFRMKARELGERERRDLRLDESNEPKEESDGEERHGRPADAGPGPAAEAGRDG